MTEVDITITEGRREAWFFYLGVGGYICAEPEPELPDSICGMPVEDEPCPIHHPEATQC